MKSVPAPSDQLLRGALICFQATASVTVETVTVLPVGMETNVNSSVISAHGRASGDARLQMAKSAATEVCLPASHHAHA